MNDDGTVGEGKWYSVEVTIGKIKEQQIRGTRTSEDWLRIYLQFMTVDHCRHRVPLFQYYLAWNCKINTFSFLKNK